MKLISRLKRKQSPGLVIAIIIAVILSGWVISGGVTGYGTMVVEIKEVSGFGPAEVAADDATYNSGLIAGWNMPGYWAPAWTNPTGVRMQIQGRTSYLETLKDHDDAYKVVTAADGKVHYEKMSVREVRHQFVVTIVTEGDGTDVAFNTKFVLEIQENDYNMFEKADHTMAYIIEVFTISTDPNPGFVELSPVDSAHFFDTDVVTREPVPAWILDMGYTEYLGESVDVSFELEVTMAQPGHWMTINRVDKKAYFTIGVDVLMFGHWVSAAPFQSPNPTPSWLALLLDDIQAGMLLIGGGIVIVGVFAAVAVVLLWMWRVRFTTKNKKPSSSFTFRTSKD